MRDRWGNSLPGDGLFPEIFRPGKGELSICKNR